MQPKIQKHTTWKFCQSISGASVIYMVRTLSHNIIWSFACHTRKTYDLLKLWTSLYEMWQTWWAGCLCDSHSVSVWTVCVCDCACMCLAVTGEFPDSPDPDEWVTVCPCVCVFVYAHVATAESCTCFLIDAEYPSPWFSDALITAPSNKQTNIVLSTGCYKTYFTQSMCFSRACYFTCQTPRLLTGRWSFLKAEHHQPLVRFMTHTDRRVAVCSASRHATMTKY